MDLKDFCFQLGHKDSLNSTEKGLALLRWQEVNEPGSEISAAAISRLMRDNGLGNPNSTILGRQLGRTRLVLKSTRGFKLKTGAYKSLNSIIEEILDHTPINIDHSQAYLPEALWKNTRGYLEKVCVQLNGCHKFGFLDAASVMMRRVVETLIIEAYEHLKRENEVKGSDGNYFMLGELVAAAVGPNGLSLGRETKSTLLEIKQLGDRSAHNRRYNAVKPDLEGNTRSGFRIAVDELINMASLRHDPR